MRDLTWVSPSTGHCPTYLCQQGVRWTALVILVALALGEDGSHTSTTERSTEPRPAKPIAGRGPDGRAGAARYL